MKSFNELYDQNGKYITDAKYKAILKLDSMLTKAGIPHTCKKIHGWLASNLSGTRRKSHSGCH